MSWKRVGLPSRTFSVYNRGVFLFGHLGITLGLALGAEFAFRRQAVLSSKYERIKEVSDSAAPGPCRSRLAMSISRLDYRIVLLGAMLPDIIDKPVSFLFPVDGRVFGHSLLFFLIIFAVGIYRFLRADRPGFLVLAICSGFHILLDNMWLMPHTLFWPLYGLGFPLCDVTMSGWLTIWFQTLKTEPAVFVPEVIGAFIMILFVVELLRGGSLPMFLRNGVVGKKGN